MDKLWINYYAQLAAYPLARIEFLKREEYTHFVICPDDLIVKQRDIDILTNECERFDSISGWCNLWHTGPYSELSNVSFNLPPNPPNGHTIEDYNFANMTTIDTIRETINLLLVKHQGTALTFLSRKVLEKVPLKTSDSFWLGDNPNDPVRNLLIDKKPASVVLEK
jgi:hypothetical protein